MNAEVHTPVGVATAAGLSLIIPAMKIDSVPTLIVCTGCAALGSILPDIDANGDSVLEADVLIGRKRLKINELLVNQVEFQKGTSVVSNAGCSIESVEEHDTFYRCFFLTCFAYIHIYIIYLCNSYIPNIFRIICYFTIYNHYNNII